jgi:hypothetical protein
MSTSILNLQAAAGLATHLQEALRDSQREPEPVIDAAPVPPPARNRPAEIRLSEHWEVLVVRSPKRPVIDSWVDAWAGYCVGRGHVDLAGVNDYLRLGAPAVERWEQEQAFQRQRQK